MNAYSTNQTIPSQTLNNDQSSSSNYSQGQNTISYQDPFNPSLNWNDPYDPFNPQRQFDQTITIIREHVSNTPQKQLHEIYLLIKKKAPYEEMSFDLEDSSIYLKINDERFIIKYQEGEYVLRSGMLKVDGVSDVDFEPNKGIVFKTSDFTVKAIIKI